MNKRASISIENKLEQLKSSLLSKDEKENLPTDDYLESYRRIMKKLKSKSILRKPNYGEASDQLNQLINSLKSKEKAPHSYAAFCGLAVARCEEAMKNFLGQAAALSDAGHIFFLNELDNKELSLMGFEEDSLEATNCYLAAIKIYINNKKPIMAAVLYVEMASILKKLGKLADAAEYYQKAAELQQSDGLLNAIGSLEEAVDCNVKMKDYKNSCANLIWIIKLAYEVFNTQQEVPNMKESENSPRNSPRQTGNSSADFLQARDFIKKLGEDAQSSGIKYNPSNTVVYLLDTLVTLCEARDLNGVKTLHRELWSALTPRQNEIILLIIDEMLRHQKLVL